MKQLYLLFFLSIILMACGSNGSKQQQEKTLIQSTLKYAKGFTIEQSDEYKHVTIFNPWKEGEVLRSYYIWPDGSIAYGSIDSKRKQEIKSLAITSCTHIEFLNLLGELSSVKGVCNPELIYNESLLKRVAQGEVISLGDAFNTNIERLLLLNPDALMMSSYNQQDENSKRIEAAGIPVIYNNEWMESTLLGRAEWIKLIGAFYGQDQLADSLFNVMESAYLNAMQLTSELKDKPSVMAGGNFKGTWYMPSGASYMGRLFDDAGAHYRYANEMSAGSLPLNFETVLHEFANCDIWLNAPTQSMQELMEMDSRHGLFEPAKQGRVYGFYNRINEQGGNDFWESAVAHPDIVLQDVIWAIYPELMENYVPTYISKLN